MHLTRAAEAGGISEGGLATAAENMDGTMTDIVMVAALGPGGGWWRQMGKGLMLKTAKK